MWCALFNTGPHAVLDGLSALEAAGLRGYEPAVPHVIAPKGSRPWRRGGVSVLESRRFRRADVHPLALPPRMTVEAAAVHAALRAVTLRHAAAILAAVVQQRLAPAGALQGAFQSVRRHRWRKPLLAVLADVVGGAHSIHELDFASLARRAGLPEPDRQVPRFDSSGRRRYLDVDYDAWRVTVEIDGMPHLEVLQAIDDAVRQNDIVIGGRRVLRMPGLLLRTDPAIGLDQVRRLLIAQGWRPTARPSQRPNKRAA